MNLSVIDEIIRPPWSYPDNDCWSVFRRASLEVFNIRVPEITVPEQHNPGEAAILFDEHAASPCWVRLEELEPGCAVLFRSRGVAQVPVHIGLHVHIGNVVHCAQRLNGRYDHIGVLRRLFGSAEYYRYDANHSI